LWFLPKAASTCGQSAAGGPFYYTKRGAGYYGAFRVALRHATGMVFPTTTPPVFPSWSSHQLGTGVRFLRRIVRPAPSLFINSRRTEVDVQTSFDKKGRHPEFDRYWEKYHKLVYYVASKLATRFGTGKGDLLGTLILRFNACLYNYDDSKGSFVSYYRRRCHRALWLWMRYESQQWADLFAKKATLQDVRLAAEYGRTIDLRSCLATEVEGPAAETLVDYFDSLDECWEFVTRCLPPRAREMFVLRYRGGRTLAQVGDKFGVGGERARQLLIAAKRKVERQLRSTRSLADLVEAWDGTDNLTE
jgi:RNA polymerase sigma factor (sigma-70 family)